MQLGQLTSTHLQEVASYFYLHGKKHQHKRHSLFAPQLVARYLLQFNAPKTPELPVIQPDHIAIQQSDS